MKLWKAWKPNFGTSLNPKHPGEERQPGISWRMRSGTSKAGEFGLFERFWTCPKIAMLTGKVMIDHEKSVCSYPIAHTLVCLRWGTPPNFRGDPGDVWYEDDAMAKRKITFSDLPQLRQAGVWIQLCRLPSALAFCEWEKSEPWRILAEQKILGGSWRNKRSPRRMASGERSTEKFMPCEACEADEKWTVWENFS